MTLIAIIYQMVNGRVDKIDYFNFPKEKEVKMTSFKIH